MKPEDIGVAVAPGPVHQAPDPSPITPMSAASYETTSRLLPDMPTYSLFPRPLRLSSQHNGVSPIDAPTPSATSFGLPVRPAPRGRGTMDTSQMHMHLGQPTLRAVPSDPFLDASSSSRTVDPRQFQTLPAQRSTTAVPPPVIQQSGQWAQPVQLHRKPVPARLPPSLHSGQAIRRSPNAAELPPHPATRSIDPSTFPTPPPVRRKSLIRRKVSRKRPETYFSTHSETDFEDDDSDIEPPALQPTLSTVVESPPRRVQTAGVRYPPVPTSAAESPSVNRQVRQVRREREVMELNPASDRSRRASPKTPNPKDKALPNVPELGGRELRDRDDNSDRIKPGSAKWNILVAPGFEGIENISSPRSKASGEWTPSSTTPNTPRRMK
ncbi:MAG: hypothetical protein Q9174_007139 [Haloplaca sp. 1 TL-2023]